MKIDKIKLANLHTYFQTGGSTENEDVMEHLGTDDVSVAAAYVARLKVKYPDLYAADEPETVEAEEEESYTYFLKEDGILRELELAHTKNNKLIFSVKAPKDLVTLMIKGKPVEVDLIDLAKYPGDSPHGVVNSKLIELAQLAR